MREKKMNQVEIQVITRPGSRLPVQAESCHVFDDPVEYLRSLGLDAELIDVIGVRPSSLQRAA
jgi:hypothetical protein